jgi:hypothetical protein
MSADECGHGTAAMNRAPPLRLSVLAFLALAACGGLVPLGGPTVANDGGASSRDTRAGDAAATSGFIGASADAAAGSDAASAACATGTAATTRAGECTFAIDSVARASLVPSRVNVILDGSSGAREIVSFDSVNGWAFDDPVARAAVILQGAACDAARADSGAAVTLILGCATVTR